ncbi:hypothetical protein GE107_17885 [Cohnella sp. CFH 77786]|nr:hypothetical protein [Cohnella sp. CFH 77786]MBW5447928.1 hypothetical protein [Cohnella sp. CFH 77786]
MIERSGISLRGELKVVGMIERSGISSRDEHKVVGMIEPVRYKLAGRA